MSRGELDFQVFGTNFCFFKILFSLFYFIFVKKFVKSNYTTHGITGWDSVLNKNMCAGIFSVGQKRNDNPFFLSFCSVLWRIRRWRRWRRRIPSTPRSRNSDEIISAKVYFPSLSHTSTKPTWGFLIELAERKRTGSRVCNVSLYLTWRTIKKSQHLLCPDATWLLDGRFVSFIIFIISVRSFVRSFLFFSLATNYFQY
jgi:hypothetical protein